MNKTLKQVSLLIAILLIGVWIYVPIYFMFISAFKSAAEIYKYPPSLIFNPSISAFFNAFSFTYNFGINWYTTFFNSFVVSLTATAVALLLGVPVAFSLAHLMKNKYGLAFSILTLRMLPPVVVVLP